MEEFLPNWKNYIPSAGGLGLFVSECIRGKKQPGQELCAHRGLGLSGRARALAKWVEGDEEEKFHLKSQAVTCHQA